MCIAGGVGGGGRLNEGGDYFKITFPSKGGDFEEGSKLRGGYYSRKCGMIQYNLHLRPSLFTVHLQ